MRRRWPLAGSCWSGKPIRTVGTLCSGHRSMWLHSAGIRVRPRMKLPPFLCVKHAKMLYSTVAFWHRKEKNSFPLKSSFSRIISLFLCNLVQVCWSCCCQLVLRGTVWTPREICPGNATHSPSSSCLFWVTERHVSRRVGFFYMHRVWLYSSLKQKD